MPIIIIMAKVNAAKLAEQAHKLHNVSSSSSSKTTTTTTTEKINQTVTKHTQ